MNPERDSALAWCRACKKCLAICLVTAIGTLRAADRPIREMVTLPVDGQVARTLFTVDEFLAEKRYEELTDLLINLSETHGRELVALPRETGVPAVRYMNVGAYCQRILASLPPEGRLKSRQQLDRAAKRWYDAWRTQGDVQSLQRIVRSAYISSYGDNALWELGELAWEQGDANLAAASWRQLLPSTAPAGQGDHPVYPDAEFPPADVAARLVLCEIFARRFDEAERELAYYRTVHAAARGTLAGREGPLAEILADILRDARQWTFPASASQWTTFAGHSTRHWSAPQRLDIGPLRWTAGWPVHRLPAPQLLPASDRGPLAAFPVIDQDVIFVSDGLSIRAWNMLTGKPAWPNDQEDPSRIYPTGAPEPFPAPERPCVGVAWQTLTVHQGKLLARLGSPLTGRAVNELREVSHELVCLDVRAGQGKLLWSIPANELPGPGPAWSLEGTPVVSGSTAYAVVYRRRPDVEFALLAVDVESGEIQWLRSLCTARPHLEEFVNRVSHLLLTAGEGRLYLSTDQGAILAISPEDARLLWAVNYESQPAEGSRGVSPWLQSGLTPPVCHQGRLYVAPNDSRFLFCLDAGTGAIVWQRSTPERLRHLIGVISSPGRLLASGQSLWAFDLQDGGLSWRMIQTDAADQGYGQGLITGTSVLWPAREKLYQLQAATGELERVIPLRTPESPRSGGNVAVAQGMLFLIEPDCIAAYGEYSRLKERLEIDLSQHPADPSVWQQLMHLESGEEHWAAAARAGRAAWQRRDMLPGDEGQTLLPQFLAVLRSLERQLRDAADMTAAHDILQEISALPLSPAERGRLMWDWSQLDLLSGQPVAAVRHLHDAWEIERTTRLQFEWKPARDTVRRQLGELLARHGRESFREVDQQAQAELAAATAESDMDGMHLVLQRYPLLEQAHTVWSALVAERVRRKEWTAVWPLLREWESATEDAASRQEIARRKVAALAEAGYVRPARRLRFPVSSEAPEQAPWKYVASDWHCDSDGTERAMFPQGNPPADDLACVLLAGSRLKAVDRRTGQERWSHPVSSVPQGAAYGETLLVLAQSEGFVGRSLETGDILWQRSFPAGTMLRRFSPDQLACAPDRVTLLEPGAGLITISTIDGEIVWTWRPEQGKLQSCWLKSPERFVVQTLDPPACWFVDAASGHARCSPGTPPDLWRNAPVDLVHGGFASVSVTNSIRGFLPDSGRNWHYTGGVSQAHAHPRLLADGADLAVLIDGTTLVGLNPATGERRWGTGLAEYPLTEPDRQAACAEGVVATASGTVLRAIALADGRVRWEANVLPVGLVDWSVRAWHGQFLVTGHLPVFPPRAVFVLVHAATGKPRQVLQRPCTLSGGIWHVDEDGVVFAANSGLTAWKPLAQRAQVQAASPR